MNHTQSIRAVQNGSRVIARSAGSVAPPLDIHGSGVVVAYTEHPQVMIKRDDGSTFWWIARLTDLDIIDVDWRDTCQHCEKDISNRNVEHLDGCCATCYHQEGKEAGKVLAKCVDQDEKQNAELRAQLRKSMP